MRSDIGRRRLNTLHGCDSVASYKLLLSWDSDSDIGCRISVTTPATASTSSVVTTDAAIPGRRRVVIPGFDPVCRCLHRRPENNGAGSRGLWWPGGGCVARARGLRWPRRGGMARARGFRWLREGVRGARTGLTRGTPRPCPHVAHLDHVHVAHLDHVHVAHFGCVTWHASTISRGTTRPCHVAHLDHFTWPTSAASHGTPRACASPPPGVERRHIVHVRQLLPGGGDRGQERRHTMRVRQLLEWPSRASAASPEGSASAGSRVRAQRAVRPPCSLERCASAELRERSDASRAPQ